MTPRQIKMLAFAAALVGFAGFAGCAEQPSSAANRGLGTPPPSPSVGVNDVLAETRTPAASDGQNPFEQNVDSSGPLDPALGRDGLEPGSSGAAGCDLDDTNCICEGLVNVANSCAFYLDDNETAMNYDASLCSTPGVGDGIRSLCRELDRENDGIDCAFLVELIDCLGSSCNIQACGVVFEERFAQDDRSEIDFIGPGN